MATGREARLARGGSVDAMLDAFISTGGEVIKGIETCMASGQTWALGRRIQALQATAVQVGATSLAAEAGRQAADLKAGRAPDPTGPARLRAELAAFSRALAVRCEEAGRV